ncbi:MAG: DUF885 family protein, partial [Halobacteriaceae archaeon]
MGEANTQSASEALQELLDEGQEFQDELEEFDDYPEASIDKERRKANKWREILDRLDEVDRTQLDTNGEVEYDVFERELELRLMRHKNCTHLIPISHEGGIHSSFVRLPSKTSFDDVEDYEEYITRLQTAPEYFDQYIELMRKGIETGYTRP